LGFAVGPVSLSGYVLSAAMISAQQQSTLKGANCDIAFDSVTRRLYATDASHYEIEPAAVAFPRTVRQVSALVDAAVQTGISITARGAGTGLAGGALGDGLVIDFSRYNRQITDLDLERRTVRVGVGVILDQLNHFLRPHGFCFGPDVATSARATLGGMIANDSSGSHTPYYGTTADHVRELEVVLADGRIVMVGLAHDTLRKQRELIADLIMFHGLEIVERVPPGLLKRRPAYAIHRCINASDNLNNLLCGSEGTLGLITSAELKIVPLPVERGVALLFFGSVAEAMEATVEILALKPAAVEHLDHVLLDQTRGQLEFKAARDLLDLEHRPVPSVLAVEFFENVADSLAQLQARNLGLRSLVLKSPAQANHVWALRKAGLSLLTGRKGDAKPVTMIEDVAVMPRDLPSYVGSLQSLLDSMNLEASFYGHAGAGLLHVRPILDLHSEEDLRKFRDLAQEVSALVKQFKGSFAAEHGVGIARTEFMPAQLGEHLLGVMHEIKKSFDPNNLLNPGKIVPDGRYKMDRDLRHPSGHHLELPFEPVLAFAAKDGSFVGNLEQCNGCGGCRKETPSMCPTFIVTRDEFLSTRGRANLIRAALGSGKGERHDPMMIEGMQEALASCLSCKACTTECPSNVNLALLKAELLHTEIKKHGLKLSQRLFSNVDLLGRIGCSSPGPMNALLGSSWGRSMLQKLIGLDRQRPLPHFARTRFDRWFARHPRPASARRGRVVLWDDTFVRYHEPNIGVAAVRVLEAAGFQVELLKGRKCCGRPAFSQGHLEMASALGHHNLGLLKQDVDNAPILFLEPSCYSMFVQDYRELNLQEADHVARRCHLFDQFIAELLNHDPAAIKFKTKDANVVIHAHCHVKALMSPVFLQTLAERLPGKNVTLLNSACCGMAGGFGFLAENAELSATVAEPLVQLVRSQPFGTTVVASGTSCRHQLGHLVPIRARHMAELLADSLP
jgi:FAD/FMN-containing dehydrogenase/Fe-S oxidoreductase